MKPPRTALRKDDRHAHGGRPVRIFRKTLQLRQPAGRVIAGHSGEAGHADGNEFG